MLLSQVEGFLETTSHRNLSRAAERAARDAAGVDRQDPGARVGTGDRIVRSRSARDGSDGCGPCVPPVCRAGDGCAGRRSEPALGTPAAGLANSCWVPRPRSARTSCRRFSSGTRDVPECSAGRPDRSFRGDPRSGRCAARSISGSCASSATRTSRCGRSMTTSSSSWQRAATGSGPDDGRDPRAGGRPAHPCSIASSYYDPTNAFFREAGVRPAASWSSTTSTRRNRWSVRASASRCCPTRRSPQSWRTVGSVRSTSRERRRSARRIVAPPATRHRAAIGPGCRLLGRPPGRWTMSFQAGRDDRAAGEMPAARVVGGSALGQRGRRTRRRVGSVGRRVRGLAAIRPPDSTRTARATAVLVRTAGRRGALHLARSPVDPSVGRLRPWLRRRTGRFGSGPAGATTAGAAGDEGLLPFIPAVRRVRRNGSGSVAGPVVAGSSMGGGVSVPPVDWSSHCMCVSCECWVVWLGARQVRAIATSVRACPGSARGIG